jgi:predicted dehydrogenase
MKKKIRKFIRFSSIYGFHRTAYKALGRMRLQWIQSLVLFPKKRYISIAGCGQFAFSTIAYFLKREHGTVFLSCFDVNRDNAGSLAKFYKFKSVSDSFDDLVKMPELKLLYISSTHSTHTDYAIKAIEKNLKVFIEKPVSVDLIQFNLLRNAIEKYKPEIYAGYNRPFAGAIIKINEFIRYACKPMSINYYISGHLIPKDHWYRNKGEGTRICGNAGHWIDLTINLFNTRGFIPEDYNISVSYSNPDEPDDNISIVITTSYCDIVSIMLSSRSEPFEGINEIINIQCGEVIAKIDDFRELAIWKNEHLYKKKYFPKDVGHKRSINQPWGKYRRDWHEVELSTLLMLHIKDMVENGTANAKFKFD